MIDSVIFRSAAVGLCTALTFYSCSTKQPSAYESVSVEAPLKTQNVEVIHPNYRSFSAELMITGTAEPNREVSLKAMESGYVKSVFKDIGDAVAKDEVIAELENPEIYRQHQQLLAEVEGKQRNYERLKSTHQKTPAITPLYLLEDAKAAYLSVKAQLDGINDRMLFLKVKAPFAGIITRRMVDEGAVVQSGIASQHAQALFEIQELNTIRVAIPLPESDAGMVTLGMNTEVTFPELPGASYKAHISRMANSLDRSSKTMQIEIDIANPDGRIKPGMYAKAVMQLTSRDSVLSLPVTAQIIYQNQPQLLMVVNGIVQSLELRKGLANKDYFEVLNSEVTAAANVIIQGKGLVKSGQKVKPVFK